MTRPSARTAAASWVEAEYPDCSCAILAGSAAAGALNDESDLDLVIVGDSPGTPHHLCTRAWGWPIEVFYMTPSTYRRLFEANRQAGTGALQRMIACGSLLKDDGRGARIRAEAERQLKQGPPPWTLDDMNRGRYELSELLADFRCGQSPGESSYTLVALARKAPEFLLRVQDRWSGEGKWLYRLMKQCEPDFAERWLAALAAYWERGDKAPVGQLVDELLTPYGGRLFEGYYQEAKAR